MVLHLLCVLDTKKNATDTKFSVHHLCHDEYILYGVPISHKNSMLSSIHLKIKFSIRLKKIK